MKSTSISGRIIIKSLMIFLATTFVLSNSLYPANTGWPKQIKTQNGKILIYQLQPESFAGDKLTARAAVSYTKDGATQSTFGAIWTKSKVNTDRENRTVTLLDMKITNVKFPAEVASDKIEAFKKAVEDETPKWELQFSLDDLLTSLQMNESGIKASKNLNNNPPEIIYVKQPSFLLSFDGEPEFSAIAQSDVKQAMNTPFFVVQDGNNHYYLYGGDFWYTTDDVLHGHWTNISELPGEVKKLQDQYNYETLKKKQQNQTNNPTRGGFFGFSGFWVLKVLATFLGLVRAFGSFA